MRKTFLSVLIIIFLVSVKAWPQTPPYELIKCIENPGGKLLSDHIGNFYVINNSTLKKFDTHGNFLFSYTDLSDGNIGSVDVTDPLKILLFNHDYGKIKFLDNKLSLQQDYLNLSIIGFNTCSLAAISSDNGFWIYDPQSVQLIKIDNSMKVIQSSGNIADLTSDVFDPDFMVETNNKVYINNPETGLAVFDKFGTYLKLIPLKNLEMFQIFNNIVYYIQNQHLIALNLNNYEERKMLLPESGGGLLGFAYTNNHLALLFKDRFCIYRINF